MKGSAEFFLDMLIARGGHNHFCLHPPFQIDGKVTHYRIRSKTPGQVAVRVNGEKKTVLTKSFQTRTTYRDL